MRFDNATRLASRLAECGLPHILCIHPIPLVFVDDEILRIEAWGTYRPSLSVTAT
jgi:hypothetical protein